MATEEWMTFVKIVIKHYVDIEIAWNMWKDFLYVNEIL